MRDTSAEGAPSRTAPAIAPSGAAFESSEIQSILRGAEAEYNYRQLTGFWGGVVAVVGVVMASFHLYTAYFGSLEAIRQRSAHLSFVLALVFLLYPARKGATGSPVRFRDVVMVSIGLVPMLYVFANHVGLALRAGSLTQRDLLLGVLGIIVVLEAGRRLMQVLPIIALVAMLYPFVGPYMPGILAIPRVSPERLIEQMFFTTEGIFGIPLGVSATFVFLFVLMGAFMERTGLGQLFVESAMALAGWMTGGPAKVSVLSSAFVGTISGSSVANVVADGVFNIPLMRRVGYAPRFAAGVVAAAGVGGQIMPPVMGAAAFVMAEFLGVPYLTIAKAAAIPAVMYYLSLMLIIHFEAKRLGLAGLSRDQLPRLGQVLARRFYVAVPLAVVIWILVRGDSPMRVAFWGIVSAMGVQLLTCLLERRLLVWPRELWNTMVYGSRLALSVAVATAVVGIFIGVVTMSGLGLAFVSLTVRLGQSSLFLTLVWVMIACNIIGSGIPTTATYIILAAIAAPALVQLGVMPLAAHLFIFYYGCTADITPPDALAAYAAAGIAKTDPFRTGLTATRLALAGILVPFVFSYSPTILLQGATLFEIFYTVVTAVIGIFALSTAVSGFFLTPANWLERGLLAVAALALVFSAPAWDAVGVGLLVVVAVTQVLRRRGARNWGAAAG